MAGACIVVGQSRLAPAQAPESAVTPFAARKAQALLRDQLACLGCHAFGAEGGRIAPDLLTVRERRSAAYIAAMVDDPQRNAPGSTMPRQTLAPVTRELLVRYLQSLPGSGAMPPAPAHAPAPTADGAALYSRWCASCHGRAGRGDGPNASHLPVKPAVHADPEAMRTRSDDALYDTIAGGGAIMNRSPRMPAFGGTLTVSQLRALVSEIRRLCGCGGPAWSAR